MNYHKPKPHAKLKYGLFSDGRELKDEIFKLGSRYARGRNYTKKDIKEALDLLEEVKGSLMASCMWDLEEEND